jgi:hypothetical protein
MLLTVEVVNIVTKLRDKRPGNRGWIYDRGRDFFPSVFSTAPRRSLGPAQSAIHCVPWGEGGGVKWLGREVGLAPSSVPEVKNSWSYVCALSCIFVASSFPRHRVTLPFAIISPLNVGRDSSVGIETSYGLDGPGIESQWGWDFPHQSRPALGPTQSVIQWVPVYSRG